MGNRYLTNLADVLRAAGLRVVEVDHMNGSKIVQGPAWKSRGRSSGGFDGSRPWGICWHHTASSPNTSAESNVAYATFNSENSPICQLYLHRDGVWYVCAAGATNTEGKGGPQPTAHGTIPLDQGNTHYLGIEAGNSGVGEAWPQAQIDSYFTGTNALSEAYDIPLSDVLTHTEWAPGRKIDPATANAVQGPWRPSSVSSSGTWDGDDVRSELAVRADPGPVPPLPGPTPPQGDLMYTLLDLTDVDAVLGGYMDSNGICAVAEWLSPARYATMVSLGAPSTEIPAAWCTGITLLGPVPPGMVPEQFARVIQ